MKENNNVHTVLELTVKVRGNDELIELLALDDDTLVAIQN